MLRVEKPKSVFQIKKGWYILLDGEYQQIEEYSIKNMVIDIKLENTEDRINIKESEIAEYDFASFNDPSGAIGVEKVYTCKLCNNPNIAFAELDSAMDHAEKCLFNSGRQSCVLCKHLKIIEEPPYPRFEKDYKSVETYHAFGKYKQPYCMKKEKNIDEEELFGVHNDCFLHSEDPVVTEWTDEFTKYMDLINRDMSEELRKEMYAEGILTEEDEE